MFERPVDHAPTTYQLERVGEDGNARITTRGHWTKDHRAPVDPNAVVARLDENTPPQFTRYMVVGKQAAVDARSEQRPARRQRSVELHAVEGGRDNWPDTISCSSPAAPWRRARLSRSSRLLAGRTVGHRGGWIKRCRRASKYVVVSKPRRRHADFDAVVSFARVTVTTPPAGGGGGSGTEAIRREASFGSSPKTSSQGGPHEVCPLRPRPPRAPAPRAAALPTTPISRRSWQKVPAWSQWFGAAPGAHGSFDEVTTFTISAFKDGDVYKLYYGGADTATTNPN